MFRRSAGQCPPPRVSPTPPRFRNAWPPQDRAGGCLQPHAGRRRRTGKPHRLDEGTDQDLAPDPIGVDADSRVGSGVRALSCAVCRTTRSQDHRRLGSAPCRGSQGLDPCIPLERTPPGVQDAGKPSPSRLRQIALNYGVPMARWQPESAIPRSTTLADRGACTLRGVDATRHSPQRDKTARRIGPSTDADDDGGRTTTHSGGAPSATNPGPTPAPRRRYFHDRHTNAGQPHAAVVAELGETLLQDTHVRAPH